ncbi:hypothetical protein STEG23_026425, partial [Scotinomys teguina]
IPESEYQELLKRVKVMNVGKSVDLNTFPTLRTTFCDNPKKPVGSEFAIVKDMSSQSIILILLPYLLLDAMLSNHDNTIISLEL